MDLSMKKGKSNDELAFTLQVKIQGRV